MNGFSTDQPIFSAFGIRNSNLETVPHA